MNDQTAKIPRRWLNPSAALSRFKPPRGVTVGIAPIERQRTRYGFRVGGIGLLIGQNTVSEVLEQASVYPLPNTPSWLLGVVNLRGNLVPVFDVKQLLELEEEGAAQEKRRILILDQGDKAVGVLIDGLPQTALTSHVIARLPPLPVALQTHVAKAYGQEGVVWLEFDHQGFFKALAQHIVGAS